MVKNRGQSFRKKKHGQKAWSNFSWSKEIMVKLFIEKNVVKKINFENQSVTKFLEPEFW